MSVHPVSLAFICIILDACRAVHMDILLIRIHLLVLDALCGALTVLPMRTVKAVYTLDVLKHAS